MNFSFIQITDHHLTASEKEFSSGFSTRHAFRTVLRHIADNVKNHVDFIVSTGDIVDIPSEISYQSFLDMVNAQNMSSLTPGLYLFRRKVFKISRCISYLEIMMTEIISSSTYSQIVCPCL